MLIVGGLEKCDRTIRADGTQQAALGTMQTRDELYETLDYLRYERELDALAPEEA